ncbi:hypothetical protein [Lactococcus lactis]|uniref:hypothetical protein n=2 Tax=Lactococcus lactis TaxID=1358 RepID=UPI001D18BF00|nr:hypothetical protein [Lactococcus lactis]MCC4121519.1 hypothetical protein [Lactococcus lactis]
MNKFNSNFKIDFDNLFLELSQNVLFKNENINKKFFSDWKEILIQSEEVFLSNVSMKPLKIQNYPLYFKLPLKKKDYEFAIPLFIPRLIAEIHNSDVKAQTVETNIFGKDIKYNADYELQKMNIEPIIVLLEEIIGENLLVDGNHRIKYAKMHDIKTVDAYIIRSPFLVNHPLSFGYHFHYAFYCFLLDYMHFNNISEYHPVLRHFPFYEKYFYHKHSSKDWVAKYLPVFEKNFPPQE